MPKKSRSRNDFKAGDLSGNEIIVGDGGNIIKGNNIQVGNYNRMILSEADLKGLHETFSGLNKEIESSAPPEIKEQALQRANELQRAVLADKPDTSTMLNIRDWFVKNLPGIAGTVTGVLVNPIVGKLVQAAGDLAVKESNRRLGA